MTDTSQTIKILHLEDAPTDAEIVERELRRSGITFSARRVATKAAFAQALTAFHPDLVLSDYNLPDFDGLAAIRMVREYDEYLPIILVTGVLRDEAAIAVVEAGANDYVLKDHLARLPFAVRRVLKEAAAAKARRHAEEALRDSEIRYRRLFEAARDGVLILNAETGDIVDSNPFMTELLGYTREEFVGKKLSDIGLLSDVKAQTDALIALQAKQYARYENLPLRAKDGRTIYVEFVSNVYSVRDRNVIQCNIRDITERHAAEEEIIAFARTDALTGLANRRAFLDNLNDSLVRSKRNRSAFAVLYLDLDRFKDVNDSLGHLIGDRLLQAVAERLRQTVRQTDLVARFGGDEFAVLQADITEPSDAGILAAKILKSLSVPLMFDGNEVRITTSVGIALCRGEIDTAEAMLDHADLALYRAKTEGRDQFCFHSPDLDRGVREQVTMADELRVALQQGEMQLYYQPQISYPEGRIVGLEALLRWNHPRRGLVLPATFLPVAEKTGLILSLGHWVTESVCRQIRAWLDAGIELPVVAMNVSGAQLKVAAQFVQGISVALSHWRIPASAIVMELSESVLMETARDHPQELDHLRNLGLGIAIDDFGTGYSSFDYLRSYPFARIKIGQPLVQEMTTDASHAAIVRGVIGLARELGIEVMAEGVETKAQMEFLAEAGCSLVQGLYYGEAVPADRVVALLRQGTLRPIEPKVSSKVT